MIHQGKRNYSQLPQSVAVVVTCLIFLSGYILFLAQMFAKGSGTLDVRSLMIGSCVFIPLIVASGLFVLTTCFGYWTYNENEISQKYSLCRKKVIIPLSDVERVERRQAEAPLALYAFRVTLMSYVIYAPRKKIVVFINQKRGFSDFSDFLCQRFDVKPINTVLPYPERKENPSDHPKKIPYNKKTFDALPISVFDTILLLFWMAVFLTGLFYLILPPQKTVSEIILICFFMFFVCVPMTIGSTRMIQKGCYGFWSYNEKEILSKPPSQKEIRIPYDEIRKAEKRPVPAGIRWSKMQTGVMSYVIYAGDRRIIIPVDRKKDYSDLETLVCQKAEIEEIDAILDVSRVD